MGGTNGFISDDAINRGGDPQYAKPWNNGQSQYDAMNDFYKLVSHVLLIFACIEQALRANEGFVIMGLDVLRH